MTTMTQFRAYMDKTYGSGTLDRALEGNKSGEALAFRGNHLRTISPDGFIDPTMLQQIEAIVKRFVAEEQRAAAPGREPIAPARVSRCNGTLTAAACAVLAVGAAYLAIQKQ